MSNDLPYLPLWVSDLMSDRKALIMNDAEFGLYMKLLFTQWLDGAFTHDEALSISSIKGKVIPAKVLACFDLQDELYTNKRLEEQRNDSLEKLEKRKQAGRKGGVAKAKQSSSNAKAKAEQCPSNALASKVKAKDKDKTSREENINKEIDLVDPTSAVFDSNYNAIADHWAKQRKTIGKVEIMNGKNLEGMVDLLNLINADTVTLEDAKKAIDHAVKSKTCNDWSLAGVVNNISNLITSEIDYSGDKPQKVSLANKNQTVDDDKYDH